MSYESLEREGLIRRLPVNEKRVRDALDLSIRDLKTAEKTLSIDSDWAYSIAYNSMLQAGRALMFSKGYRPAGKVQHVSVIKFIEASLGKSPEAIIAFDRMRRKRHTAVYDTVGTVSDTQARTAIKWAEEFIQMVKNILVNSGFR